MVERRDARAAVLGWPVGWLLRPVAIAFLKALLSGGCAAIGEIWSAAFFWAMGLRVIQDGIS
jgi:hypothetical protein